ncbi:mCG147208 [Mus musculus]|nr:mCG147208 [Mus musculus]
MPNTIWSLLHMHSFPDPFFFIFEEIIKILKRKKNIPLLGMMAHTLESQHWVRSNWTSVN